jgi:hypothetical protein
MRHTLKLAAFAAALVAPVIVSPQAMTGPAQVLRIGREIVKPGKDGAHTKWETAWSRAIEAAKYPGTFIALTAMTGSNEAWFVWGYPSLAAMQKENETADASATLTAIGDRYSAAESEYLQDGRTMILTRRDDLSYSTSRPLSEMRFLSATRILVRPGHTAEFVEARTAVKAAHEKAKLPDGYGIYQVVDGMPGGTYYLFAARKSLSEVDDGAKIHNDPAYLAALGADWTKRNAALVAAYETSAETNLFSVSPGMSSVPKEWVAADSYWKPKATAKKAP